MTRLYAWLLITMLGAPGDLLAQQTARASDSLLVQRERAQWNALQAQDTSSFARLMGGNVVDVDVSGIKATSPASTSQYVRGCKTTSFTLSDIRVAHYTATAVVTYKATVEATCWGQKAPSPLYVLTVYEQHGDAWQPVAHSETPAPIGRRSSASPEDVKVSLHGSGVPLESSSVSPGESGAARVETNVAPEELTLAREESSLAPEASRVLPGESIAGH